MCLTLGADGAAVLRAGRSSVWAAAPTVEVVDRTGVGDAFTGTYFASWLSERVAEGALQRAAIGAALSLAARSDQGLRMGVEAIKRLAGASANPAKVVRA